jgi:phospholipid/cholesterol/gamma-HCH transport system substrate-binding protein
MSRNDSKWSIAAFLGGVFLILLGLVAVARYPALISRGREYHTLLRSVAGLDIGDEVKYGGLTVGTITRMALDTTDATRILVTFRVKRSTPIRTDTRATIGQVGFLGEPYLNLRPGRPNAPALAGGSTLPADESASFQEAMSRLASFLDRADTLMGSAERIAQMTPWQRIDRLFTRLDTLVTSTTRGSDRVFTQLERSSDQLNGVLARTERVIAAIDTTVASARPDLKATQREMLATLTEMRILVSDLRDAMQEGGGVDQLMRNVSAASDNMARLAERIERDPTSVLQRRAPPKKSVGPKP